MTTLYIHDGAKVGAGSLLGIVDAEVVPRIGDHVILCVADPPQLVVGEVVMVEHQYVPSPKPPPDELGGQPVDPQMKEWIRRVTFEGGGAYVTLNDVAVTRIPEGEEYPRPPEGFRALLRPGP